MRLKGKKMVENTDIFLLLEDCYYFFLNLNFIPTTLWALGGGKWYLTAVLFVLVTILDVLQ